MELIINVGEQSDLPPVPPNFPRCGNFKAPIKTLTDNDGSSCEEETNEKTKRSDLSLPSEAGAWISSQISSQIDLFKSQL